MRIGGRFILLLIFGLGLFLRLYGLNWDQGFHLHPDERFLTMVSTDISFPNSIGEYFDRHSSSLNPENNKHPFFVYGLAPVAFNKFIGELLLNNTYDTIHLQGRFLSAIADTLVMIILFKILRLAEQKLHFHEYVAHFGVLFYAIAVLPIQLSHFFTVDTFLNVFGWVSIYYSLVLLLSKDRHVKMKVTFFSGAFLGLSFASKVSAIYYAPPIVFVLFLFFIKEWKRKSYRSYLYLLSLIWILTFYITLRFGSPYYFESGNLLDLRISSQFIQSLETLKSFNVPGYFPPATQWINAPWYLSQLNMVVFGLGIPYSILAFIGLVRTVLKKNVVFTFFAVWALALLGYQTVQFAKTMRYLIFIYPLFAMYAGVGAYYVYSKVRQMTFRPLRLFVILFLYISVLVWPMSFMSIYTKNHSRVEASYWIFDNVPNGSTIAWEYWDDPLPLLVQNPMRKQFNSEQIGIFDPDSAEKWNRIQNQLLRSDYYIMSSNRGWGSIPTVPERYPLTTDFYKDMFANKRGFTLIKEFTSYPSLRYLGIPLDFPDQWAEEAFTVYDHPRVMIFKNNNE